MIEEETSEKEETWDELVQRSVEWVEQMEYEFWGNYWKHNK